MVGLKVPEFLTLGYKLEEGSPISVKVERDGKELTLEGEVRIIILTDSDMNLQTLLKLN